MYCGLPLDPIAEHQGQVEVEGRREMTPKCFCCGREAVKFDRQIGEWCCQGNPDCSMSFSKRERSEDEPRIQLRNEQAKIVRRLDKARQKEQPK